VLDDRAAADEMRERARAFAVECLALPHVLEAIDGVYASVLERKRTAA
jgi:hypothetical protein